MTKEEFDGLKLGQTVYLFEYGEFKPFATVASKTPKQAFLTQKTTYGTYNYRVDQFNMKHWHVPGPSMVIAAERALADADKRTAEAERFMRIARGEEE
jgi:hypothetical protein